ncbi:DUF1254 domain-containing protein [Microbacterium sp. KR10-403]|uniref:DUF1254 domain-containing protein n=1 Tax=Microbacterium sp. KR10-403 TaxID=3158581 RepID=UPI0032E52D19
MNRLILRFAVPIVVIVLVIFAWVVIQRLADGRGVGVLAVAALVVWAVGAPLFIWFWPRITVSGFQRAIVRRGFGSGPVAVNTLAAVPYTSAAASTGSLIATGTDDVLYVVGWIDLRHGPLTLHVPPMPGRYHALQFTDPTTGANVAYVGTRTTGDSGGDFEVVRRGAAPARGAVVLPGRQALVIGRVFVADEADRPAALALAQQFSLSAVEGKQRWS